MEKEEYYSSELQGMLLLIAEEAFMLRPRVFLEVQVGVLAYLAAEVLPIMARRVMAGTVPMEALAKEAGAVLDGELIVEELEQWEEEEEEEEMEAVLYVPVAEEVVDMEP